MANANPYAPPRAHVADRHEDDDAVQPVQTWSGRGRIGRLRYLAHTMVGYLFVILGAMVIGFVAAIIKKPQAITAASIVLGAIYFVFIVLKTIQRSHDMDWSGWMSLLALVPIVNLIWVFKGGTSGSNRFGPPAPPNTTGVKILGGLLIALFVIGIVAAVALPAYVASTARSASQMR